MLCKKSLDCSEKKHEITKHPVESMLSVTVL